MSAVLAGLTDHPIGQRIHTAYQLYNLDPPFPDDERQILGNVLLSGPPDWANAPLRPLCRCYLSLMCQPMATQAPACDCTGACDRCRGGVYRGGVDDLLSITRELLYCSDRWIVGTFSQDSAGQRVKPRSPDAVRFCVLGALYRCAGLLAPGGGAFHEAVSRLNQCIPAHEGVAQYQDSPEVTHADIMDLFQRARRL